MLSYSHLMSDSGSGRGHYVELQEEKLFGLIRLLLQRTEVDEAWYLKTNPDVAAAVKSGALESAKAHYIAAGYFENRLPRPVEVDEAWYLSEYQDVAEAIQTGAVASAHSHFQAMGFLEGRLPRAGWSVLNEGAKPAARPVAASLAAGA